MKYLGIDWGDKWVGMAISDAIGMTCRPYKTVATPQSFNAIIEIVALEKITTIVAGIPITMGGTVSDQTRRAQQQTAMLKQKLADAGHIIEIIEWDERLSSSHAQTIAQQKGEKKSDIIHARAAAFILQNYLDHQAFDRA